MRRKTGRGVNGARDFATDVALFHNGDWLVMFRAEHWDRESAIASGEAYNAEQGTWSGQSVSPYAVRSHAIPIFFFYEYFRSARATGSRPPIEGYRRDYRSTTPTPLKAWATAHLPEAVKNSPMFVVDAAKLKGAPLLVFVNRQSLVDPGNNLILCHGSVR